jgi:hypothetical protein
VIDTLRVVAFIAGIALVLFGPGLWLLVRLYRKRRSISWGGIAGRILGAIAWPALVVAGYMLLVLSPLYLNSWEAHLKQSTEVSKYEDVLASWKDSSRIAHFPQDVSPEQVRYFRSGDFPLMNTTPPFRVFVVLAMDVSPKQAKALHQKAEQRAVSIVTWRDSTSSDSTVSLESVVLKSSSSSRQSSFSSFSTYMFNIPLQRRASLLPDRSESDYVAYLFGSYPMETYGIAFHKHRSLVIYWAEEAANPSE